MFVSLSLCIFFLGIISACHLPFFSCKLFSFFFQHDMKLFSSHQWQWSLLLIHSNGVWGYYLLLTHCTHFMIFFVILFCISSLYVLVMAIFPSHSTIGSLSLGSTSPHCVLLTINFFWCCFAFYIACMSYIAHFASHTYFSFLCLAFFLLLCSSSYFLSFLKLCMCLCVHAFLNCSFCALQSSLCMPLPSMSLLWHFFFLLNIWAFLCISYAQQCHKASMWAWACE